MSPWPHQQRAIREFLDRIDLVEDYKGRICLTSPTGGGKTFIAQQIITEFLQRDLPVVIYTNRKMLREQISRTFSEAGFEHGIRAAGVGRDSKQLLQISSIQTEHSKVTKRDEWDIHSAKLVVVDEAHLQNGETVETILKRHEETNAVILGLTATPLDLGDTYKHLIIAGKNSELRKCGALVPAIHYGPDEPDLKHVRTPEGEDLTEKENRAAIMREGIFGRVLEAFNAKNPKRKPTILFAPGIGESLWFAGQFADAGITACHIDGNEIWLDGERYPSTEERREEIARRSREGEIAVICNRYVMREGIDFRWIECVILATVFGSLKSYLQSGGRGLRACPETGKRSLTVLDHGGNWWRHGSLNEDRLWDLELTLQMATGLRLDRIRSGEKVPVRCPKCQAILATKTCPCGFVVDRKTCQRAVVQSDGTLKMMSADPLRPRRISNRTDGPEIWKRMYWRSRTEKGRRTFKAAASLFAMENNWGWPNPTWPFMPKDPRDWYRNIDEVPMDRLTAGSNVGSNEEGTTSKCRSCGAPIRWLTTVHGKNAPIDAEPTAEGNLRIRADGVVEVVTPGLFQDGEPLYLNHFASCAHADQHKKEPAQ